MKRKLSILTIVALVSVLFFPNIIAEEAETPIVENIVETEVENEIENKIVLKNEKPVHQMNVFDTEIIHYTIETAEENYKVEVTVVPNGILDITEAEGSITVIAKAPGQAVLTILVLIDDKDITISKEIKFVVNEPKGTLKFNQSGYKLQRGAQFTVDFEVEPKTLDLSRIVWASSEPSVATVENGLVKGSKLGRTTISATLDGETHSMVVEVIAPLQKIEFNPSSILVSLNDTHEIPGIIYVPYDTTSEKNISYEVVDPSIIAIENNQIRGLKVGSTEVIAHVGNISTTLTVRVNEKSIATDAQTLLMRVDKEDDEGMYLSVRDFEGLNERNFELYLPTNEILTYMENREVTKLYVNLEDELLSQDLRNMVRFNIDKEIMLQLGAQKLEVHFTDKAGVTQFKTRFDSRKKEDFNLSFDFSKIKVDNPVYVEVNNEHSYQLFFIEDNLEGVSFSIHENQMKGNNEQIYFHYELVMKEISEIEMQIKSDDTGMVNFKLASKNNIISLTPIAQENFTMVIVMLSIVIVAILGSVIFKYSKQLRNKK